MKKNNVKVINAEKDYNFYACRCLLDHVYSYMQAVKPFTRVRNPASHAGSQIPKIISHVCLRKHEQPLGPGARFSKLPVIIRPVKLFCFPFQMGVSKALNIIQQSY